jgi:hypothetical protein
MAAAAASTSGMSTLLSTPAPPARRPRRPTQIASYVPPSAWPEPGVECVGTRPDEHQQKKRPAIHDREFTAVADRPEPVRKMLGEVRDSHLAGGDESRWTREQSKGDQDAGDQFDQPGQPDERASGRDGIRRPAEQQGRAVAQEQESEEDPEQAQDYRCMRVESGFQPLGHGLTIRKIAPTGGSNLLAGQLQWQRSERSSSSASIRAVFGVRPSASRAILLALLRARHRLRRLTGTEAFACQARGFCPPTGDGAGTPASRPRRLCQLI